jgi:hypothetical protein
MGFVNGESRVGRRVYGPRPTVFGMLMLAAFVMVALGAPRAAEAQVYIWKDVNGFWTEPNNWINASGGPPGTRTHPAIRRSSPPTTRRSGPRRSGIPR